MLRSALIGLWASLVMALSLLATTRFQARPPKSESTTQQAHVEMRKTKEISVPKIANGVIKGYIVTQLVFGARSREGDQLEPDAFVVDEAFRLIYEDDSLNFATVKKLDLKAYAETVRRNVNTRLNSEAVTDIAIQEFMFMPNNHLRKRPSAAE
jgi:hypothetical protein